MQFASIPAGADFYQGGLASSKLPTGSGGGGFGGQLPDGAANTAELQARNHHSAVPTLISIGEITGVGAQLGKQ